MSHAIVTHVVVPGGAYLFDSIKDPHPQMGQSAGKLVSEDLGAAYRMELLLPVFAERAGADRAEIQFFVPLGAIKLAFLWFDNEPLFIIGDSNSYLSSVLTDYAPSERSFAYGQVFIRFLLWLSGSLRAVVAGQMVTSAGSGTAARGGAANQLRRLARPGGAHH